MITLVFSAVLALTAKCDDSLRRLPPDLSRDFTYEDISKILRLPSRITGMVATLYEAPDLRIYGFANPEMDRIDRIEVWGFDILPLPLLAFHLWPAITHTTIYAKDPDYLQMLAKRLPGFEELLIRKGVIKRFMNPKQRQDVQIAAQKERMETAEEHQLEYTWQDIFEFLNERSLEQRIEFEKFIARNAIHPSKNPLASRPKTPDRVYTREAVSVNFRGFLPPQNKALAILDFRDRGKSGMTTGVYLNAKYEDAEAYREAGPLAVGAAAFPNLGERIGFERRFLAEWLVKNPESLIYLKLDTQEGPTDLHFQIQIFKDKADLPVGISYQIVDPLTGQ